MMTSPYSASTPVAMDLQAILVPQIGDPIIPANVVNPVLYSAQVPTPALSKPAGDNTLSATIPFESTKTSVIVIKAASTSTATVAPPLPKILGTARADDITGTAINEAIYGFAGDDKLRGGNGGDVIYGGWGNDIISGDHVPEQTTSSDDYLAGDQGDDKLFGRIGYDTLLGGTGNDQLFGGGAGDTLRGGSGNDQLFGGIVEGDLSFNPFPDEQDTLVGGSGNDYLDGDAGNDYLLGTDAVARGAGEIDVLIGGNGNDIFVIGDKKSSYYTQGGALQDFALINDFATGDRIRLHGNATQYVLGYDSAEHSTALGYLGNGNFDLVAVFANQDLSGMSLTSRAFQYMA